MQAVDDTVSTVGDDIYTVHLGPIALLGEYKLTIVEKNFQEVLISNMLSFSCKNW